MAAVAAIAGIGRGGAVLPPNKAAFAVLFGHEPGYRAVATVDLGARLAVIARRPTGDAHDAAGTTAIRYAERTPAGMCAVPAACVATVAGPFGYGGRVRMRRDLGPRPIVTVEAGAHGRAARRNGSR